MQGTQTYVGSEQQSHVRSREQEIRDVLDLLPCSLKSFFRRGRGPQDEATNTYGVLEKALLSAYRRSSKFKGSAQMSTWLTAVALLILGPHSQEALAAEGSNGTTDGILTVAGSCKRGM